MFVVASDRPRTQRRMYERGELTFHTKNEDLCAGITGQFSSPLSWSARKVSQSME